MTHTFSTPLSRKDFGALVETHGADLSRWPLDAVKPALALMEVDAAAKAAFADAEDIDDMLRRADALMTQSIAARHGVTAPALQARILAQIADSAQASRGAPAVVAAQAVNMARAGAFGLRSLFAPGGSLLMVGLVGFMMGFMQPASAQETLLDGLVHGQDIVIAGEADPGTIGEW